MGPDDPRRFTDSGIEVRDAYAAADVAPDVAERTGEAGEFPYTRGVYPTMHRGRPWTMRQFAGFGTPQDTNERFKFLLAQGQTGLSTAFDMPTLMGYDADHERSLGEVGREGTAVSTIEDTKAYKNCKSSAQSGLKFVKTAGRQGLRPFSFLNKHR